MTNSKDYKIEAINDQIKRKLVNREVYTCCTDIVEYILKTSETYVDAPFSVDDMENMYKKCCPNCGDNVFEITDDDIVPLKKFQCSECEELYDTYTAALVCCSDLEENEIYEPKEVWVCPFCSDVYENKEAAKNCICHYHEDMFQCCCCNGYFIGDDVDEELQEVYEWWEVSDWFADKLEAYGEVVIKSYHTYWGRCTTGQAIYADGVIHKIADDMKILYGQEHSWENKIN